MIKSYEVECEELIVERLAAAGAKGLTKTQLKLPNVTSKKGTICQEVLKRLETQGQISNLGSRTRTRYVTAQHFRPLEMAYEHIEAVAREAGTRLGSKGSYAKGLGGVIASKVDEALKLLVGEGKLLRLHWSSFSVYLHASALPQIIEPPQPVVIEQSSALSINDADVLRAYHETVAEFAYPDVLIHEVFLRLGGDLEALKTHLMHACHRGRAVASVGDWSLSSADERQAALYINGHPHLRIRLKE